MKLTPIGWFKGYGMGPTKLTQEMVKPPSMSGVEARVYAFLDSTDLGRHMKTPAQRLIPRKRR